MIEAMVSERVSRLTATLPSMAPELQAALEYASADPSASLTKSRLVLERTLRSVLAFEGAGRSGKALMVGQLLREESVKARVPPSIRASMVYVNVLAAEQGAHPGTPNPKIAFRALEHLCEIVEWYAAEYLASGLTDNFGKPLTGQDPLVLYVSSGGTCRCAMANVITRHYLAARAEPHDIRPMSVALIRPTRPTMSPEAVEVLREQLGIEVPEHRTIHGDERYWRRAQLVLAMDAKLLEQLPPTVIGKAQLFTVFYGGEGNIADPYGMGIDAYRERCRDIRGFIEPGVEILVDRLTRCCT